MRLSPREIEKLMRHNAGFLAQKRYARGLKLNYVETVALLSAQLLEFIREGCSVAELMDRGKIDIVQVDLTRVGGFTEAMKVASLAVDRGLPVVNHGFTQQLVPEMVGKMAVIAGVDVPLQFAGRFVDQPCGHGQRVDAQFLRPFLRDGSVEFGLARRNQVNGPHQFRYPELWFAERNHAPISIKSPRLEIVDPV